MFSGNTCFSFSWAFSENVIAGFFHFMFRGAAHQLWGIIGLLCYHAGLGFLFLHIPPNLVTVCILVITTLPSLVY